jgi:hypothetical protein
MTEYRVLSTCQRRGYELTDIHIWEVTRGREHIGYEKNGEPCDPPEYIDLGVGEHTRILPKDAKVIGTKDMGATKKTVAPEKKMIYNGDLNVESIVSSLQSLLDERNALLKEVEELKTRPTGPDVELVDQWRIQFRWYGSWHELEQEWGFSSQQEAEARMQKWIDTFGDKFSDVEIVHYKINKESI